LVQLEKVLAELYVYIDEQEKAGQLMVDDKEAFAARQKAKEAGEFIELDGFIGMLLFFTWCAECFLFAEVCIPFSLRFKVTILFHRQILFA